MCSLTSLQPQGWPSNHPSKRPFKVWFLPSFCRCFNRQTRSCTCGLRPSAFPCTELDFATSLSPGPHFQALAEVLCGRNSGRFTVSFLCSPSPLHFSPLSLPPPLPSFLSFPSSLVLSSLLPSSPLLFSPSLLHTLPYLHSPILFPLAPSILSTLLSFPVVSSLLSPFLSFSSSPLLSTPVLSYLFYLFYFPLPILPYPLLTLFPFPLLSCSILPPLFSPPLFPSSTLLFYFCLCPFSSLLFPTVLSLTFLSSPLPPSLLIDAPSALSGWVTIISQGWW